MATVFLFSQKESIPQLDCLPFGCETQSMTYEINTIEDFCMYKSSIFGEGTYNNYRQRLYDLRDDPNAFFGPNSIGKKLEDQLVKDLMWNYKINPELNNVFEKHVKGHEYIECPTT